MWSVAVLALVPDCLLIGIVEYSLVSSFLPPRLRERVLDLDRRRVIEGLRDFDALRRRRLGVPVAEAARLRLLEAARRRLVDLDAARRGAFCGWLAGDLLATRLRFPALLTRPGRALGAANVTPPCLAFISIRIWI
jgi:hypothetical protein